MPIKYCSKCSKGTEYSIKIPKYCSSCGDEFAKAFLPASDKSAPAPIVVASKQPAASKRVIHRRPTDIQDDSDESNENVNLDNVQEWARELAASVSSSDFIIRPATETKITLGNILQNPDQFTIGQRTEEAVQPSSE